MAGRIYMDGLWVSQGDVALVNEQVTDPGQNPDPGAVKQFVAGQVGKRIALTDPTNSGGLVSKEYQYVLRDDSTTINVTGSVLHWVDPTAGDFAVALDNGFAQVSNVPAGIFLGDDTAAIGQRGMQDGNYGFIQIGGVANLMVSAAVTAGSEVTSTGLNGLVNDRTAHTQALVGIALETGTTNDVVAVVLNLLKVD